MVGVQVAQEQAVGALVPARGLGGVAGGDPGPSRDGAESGEDEGLLVGWYPVMHQAQWTALGSCDAVVTSSMRAIPTRGRAR